MSQKIVALTNAGILMFISFALEHHKRKHEGEKTFHKMEWTKLLALNIHFTPLYWNFLLPTAPGLRFDEYLLPTAGRSLHRCSMGFPFSSSLS